MTKAYFQGIIMSVLSSIWASLGRPDPEHNPLQLREKKRAYFCVDETHADDAKTLRDWYTRHYTAEREITDYLRKATSILGGEVPLYKINEHGRVHSINFQYAIGFFHDGWTGIENTNWLVPDSDKVKQELQQLPPLPSLRDVHRMIDWPELDIDPCSQEVHVPGLRRFAVTANRQTHVSMYQGAVYISVPYPDTFRDHPALAEKVQAWIPPAFLQQIAPSEGRQAEKACDFSRSKLGETLAKTLRFGLSLLPEQHQNPR